MRIIYFYLMVLLIATASCQPSTTPQTNLASSPTAITQCPPRPTLPPFPTPTPFTVTPKPPTLAPTKTPGPPAPISTYAVVVPTLVHPITEEEALGLALEIDMQDAADWEDPWCLETIRLQPGRIVIKWYPNEYVYDGTENTAAKLGLDVSHANPIWAVTIKGNVSWKFLPFPCMGCTGPIKASGVTYLIDQKTGSLVGWSVH